MNLYAVIAPGVLVAKPHGHDFFSGAVRFDDDFLVLRRFHPQRGTFESGRNDFLESGYRMPGFDFTDSLFVVAKIFELEHPVVITNQSIRLGCAAG